MRGEDTAKLKPAQLFLYIVHMDVFNNVFPLFVIVVADAVENESGGGNAERYAQAGHIFTVGNGLVQILPVHYVENGVPEAANHKNGAVGNKAEATTAFIIELYVLDFFIMYSHNIAAGGIGHGGTPDGGHLANIVFFYKNAVVPDIGYPSAYPAVAGGLKGDGQPGEVGFYRTVVFLYHNKIGGLREGQ